MKTKIKKWGINGEGIAYYKRKPIFIAGVIPGEVVEFHITEEKDTYGIGELDRIVERSNRRRFPMCAKWKECGGCALMHVQYKEQCKMKSSAVSEALRKYAHYTERILPIVKNPEPLAYRNSCKLPLHRVHGTWVSGMYEKGTNHFIGIDRCYIHAKVLEQSRQALMPLMTVSKLEGFKTLVMKEFEQQVQIIFVTEDIQIPSDFIEKVMRIESVVSIWQSIKINESVDVFGETMKHLAGTEAMHVHFGDMDCALLPRAFFQLNTKQSMNLYSIVKDWTPKSRTIVEAYCGIGVISLFVKDKADKVIGIESNRDAVNNAQENAKVNRCDHMDFICGDAAMELKKLNRVDTLIVDPPRSGLNADMKDAILKSNINTVIYVSCNPSTLGKDLHVLQEMYRIQKVQPVDMFSQTPHVETVVLLSHKAPNSHINVKVEFGEGKGKVPLDKIAEKAEKYKPKEKVTYKKIKEYIEAKYGFKMHTAYIAEVKRAFGLPMYDAPNAVKELKQSRKHPTKDKVKAITDALVYFELISKKEISALKTI